MTFTLYDMSEAAIRAPTVIATFPTYDDAVTYARREIVISFFEEDASNPGCADFIAHSCALYAIEPTERRNPA